MLHDALRVSDSIREIGELENGSKADFLSMAISVICLADRTNKASSSKSFLALILCIVRFCSRALEKRGCGDSQAESLHPANLRVERSDPPTPVSQPQSQCFDRRRSDAVPKACIRARNAPATSFPYFSPCQITPQQGILFTGASSLPLKRRWRLAADIVNLLHTS